jgi:hypothetical protein
MGLSIRLRVVKALAVSGSAVYVGGDFSLIGGQKRNYIAAVDVMTGAPTAWDPNVNSWVKALAVSGSTIYLVPVAATRETHVSREFIGVSASIALE